MKGYLITQEQLEKIEHYKRMFDVNSDISEYVHHNKIYQYLALGKPVVVQRTHRDYDELSSVIYLCDSKKEFIDKIAVAATNVNDKSNWKIETVDKKECYELYINMARIPMWTIVTDVWFIDAVGDRIFIKNERSMSDIFQGYPAYETPVGRLLDDRDVNMWRTVDMLDEPRRQFLRVIDMNPPPGYRRHK